MIEFVSPGWRSGPVRVATTFWRRYRGISAVAQGVGVLIPGHSVHGFGVSRDISVIGLDCNDVVLIVRLLARRGVVTCGSAASMLELDSARASPAIGDVLVRRSIVA